MKNMWIRPLLWKELYRRNINMWSFNFSRTIPFLTVYWAHTQHDFKHIFLEKQYNTELQETLTLTNNNLIKIMNWLIHIKFQIRDCLPLYNTNVFIIESCSP